MVQDPSGEREEFDLRLEWPRDALIEPLDPSARRQVPARPAADEPPDGGETENQAVEAEPDADLVGDEDVARSAESQRTAVLRMLEPSVTELVADYEALVSTMSTFRDVVSGHLHSYVEEVGLMESVSSGYLKQYRDAHVRALTDLRHVVGDNPAWVQWLADSVKEMATAVDDAAQGVRELGDDARQTLTRSDAAVAHMTEAVRWLGEQLQTSVGELRGAVVPGGADGDVGALADSSVDVQRALAKLAEAREDRTAGTIGERDAATRALSNDPKIDKQLSRLVDEVRASRAFDEALVEDLMARFRDIESASGNGAEGFGQELARVAEEMAALRRRLALRSKTPATLDQEQIDAIADAVVAAVGGASATRAPRRRPLEARRTTGTETRRPRD